MTPREEAWQHRDYDLDTQPDPLCDIALSDREDKPWPVWARRAVFMAGCVFVVFVILPMVGWVVEWFEQ
jgi:hypothetical protein